MQIENERQLRILVKLATSSVPVTSEQLAELTMYSVRTVKNDLSEMNQILSSLGIAEIQASRGIGYQIQILDEPKFKDLIEKVQQTYYFFERYEFDSMCRRLFVIQRLLSSSSYRQEDIAGELFLSRNALKDDFTYAFHFFESQRITIETVPSKGSTLKGEEWDIRFAMIEAFCSQYYNFEEKYEVPAFSHQFYQSEEEYQEVRHEFLALLRNSCISLTDIQTKKIATYLCLIQKRRENGHKLELQNRRWEDLRNSREHELASQIFELSSMKKRGEVDEDEILGLTTLLVMGRDVNFKDEKDLLSIHPAWMIVNAENWKKIKTKLKKRIGSSLQSLQIFELYDRSFEALLYPLSMQNMLDHTDRFLIATYTDPDTMLCSPVATEIARNLLLCAEEVFHCQIDESRCSSFAYLVDFLLDHIRLKHTKKKLLVSSQYGKAIAEKLQSGIRDRFGDYIDRLDLYNVYEMRKLNFSDYDAVITESVLNMNYYPVPFITYSFFQFSRDDQKLFQELFASTYDRTFIDWMVHKAHLYTDFTCSDYDGFRNMISMRYGRGNESEIRNLLNHKESMCRHYYESGHIAILFLDSKSTGGSFIDLYVPENKVYYIRPKEVHYFIVASLDSKMDPSNLVLLNNLLRKVLEHPEVLEDLVAGKQSFKEILENAFYETILIDFSR